MYKVGQHDLYTVCLFQIGLKYVPVHYFITNVECHTSLLFSIQINPAEHKHIF